MSIFFIMVGTHEYTVARLVSGSIVIVVSCSMSGVDDLGFIGSHFLLSPIMGTSSGKVFIDFQINYQKNKMRPLMDKETLTCKWSIEKHDVLLGANNTKDMPILLQRYYDL